MSTSGIILLIFMFVMFTILFSFKNKLSWEKKSGRIIIDVFAILAFIYFVAARWAWNIKGCIENIDSPFKQLRDINLSKSLLLDLCPLMAFLMPIFIVSGGKKKTWAKVVAPVTIIGAAVTIFGQCIFQDISADQFIEYFFIGIVPNRMYFMMHFLSMFMAVWVLMECDRFCIKDHFRTFMFYCVWIMYITLCSRLLDIEWNVTGLVENDWISPNGEYHVVYNLFKLPFPYITIFWYTVVLVVNYLMTLCKNVSILRIKHKDSKNEEFKDPDKKPIDFTRYVPINPDDAQYYQWSDEMYNKAHGY